MLEEVEEALKEREEDVELRREKNDEYSALKKEVDEQIGKIEAGELEGPWYRYEEVGLLGKTIALTVTWTSITCRFQRLALSRIKKWGVG